MILRLFNNYNCQYAGAKVNYEGSYSRVTGFVLPTYDVSGKLTLIAPEKKDITLELGVVNKELENHKSIDYKVLIGPF